MKVLVLGHTGMLGHMVCRYLALKGHGILLTDERWPTDKFFEYLNNFDGDFVINCVAAIPQRTDDFVINFDRAKLSINSWEVIKMDLQLCIKKTASSKVTAKIIE